MSDDTFSEFVADESCPPLKHGEHLTRDEFISRWDAHPQINNAELLDGVVYLKGRVNQRYHGAPHADVAGWLGSYYFQTGDVELCNSPTLWLDHLNVPQPDVVLLMPEGQTQAWENGEGFLEGPPDLIAEVSTAAEEPLHLGLKLELYQAHQVPEFLLWRTESRLIDWFVREGDGYIPLVAENGIFKSPQFSGLWLDIAAMTKGDVRQVHATLQQGLATPEHAAFKAELLRVKE